MRGDSAMMNPRAHFVRARQRTRVAGCEPEENAMQITEADELRDLAAQLTKMGSRVTWDGDHRIQSIAMFGESITDRDLALLRKIPGLLHLNLTRTRISDAGLFHVSKLKDLEILMLGGTDVTDEGFEMFDSLVSLRQLNVTNTGITDRGFAPIAQMPKLEALWLDTTDITDAALEMLANSKTLELLDFRRTDITDQGLKHLRGLENLQELNLAGCQQITPAGLAELSGFQRLEWLCLDATSVDDESLRHLVGLPLKTLLLNWTHLGNGALAWLERLTSLTELRLLGTKIDESRVEQFRSARPNCDVHHCN